MQHLHVLIDHLIVHAVQREVLHDSIPAFMAQSLSKIRVSRETLDSQGQRGGVGRRHQQAVHAVANDVCGAPNAMTGMKSVFSPVGTYIPGKKITLAKGVIRGVESNGMLCSAAELELSNDHTGIIELPDDAPVGVAYATYAGLDDPSPAILNRTGTPCRYSRPTA